MTDINFVTIDTPNDGELKGNGGCCGFYYKGQMIKFSSAVPIK